MPIIEVQNLVKKFGDLTAVNDLSFEVNEGEAFGFLGPNGAGKTTTINILCTMLWPTSGTARVNGFDCVKDSARVRQSIGLVFQDPTLDNGLTAYENLEFHAYLYNLDRKTMKERIAELLRVVDLEARKDDVVKKFSGGMKRRLEIARGLLHRPRVFFLDEPTLGLDPQTRFNIWEFIHRLRREEGITLFMTTHYMDEAENCDRVAIIDKGRLIALDSPTELKAAIKEDHLSLVTADNEAAKREIMERFGLEAKFENGGLHLEVEKGNEFIPTLVKQLSVPVTSVTVQKPTLNEVFLRLTGRTIRAEEGGAFDGLRTRLRAKNRM